MCGRFALFSAVDALESLFGAPLGDMAPGAEYNIAPGRRLPILRVTGGRREFTLAQWGLIPPWARDPSFGYRTINARAETVAEKPAFRAAFRTRRCLIPADGFYEWQATSSGKQPYFIAREGGGPFAFAGLWESWRELQSCTIIVTQANALLQRIHERMPVILAPEDFETWLAVGSSRAMIEALLRPCPPEGLTLHPVSRRVNRPQEQGPDLIDPIDITSRQRATSCRSDPAC